MRYPSVRRHMYFTILTCSSLETTSSKLLWCVFHLYDVFQTALHVHNVHNHHAILLKIFCVSTSNHCRSHALMITHCQSFCREQTRFVLVVPIHVHLFIQLF